MRRVCSSMTNHYRMDEKWYPVGYQGLLPPNACFYHHMYFIIWVENSAAEVACACGVWVLGTLPSWVTCAYGYFPWSQGSWGQHVAYLGPAGPRWAHCWSHQLCYLGILLPNYKLLIAIRRIIYIESPRLLPGCYKLTHSLLIYRGFFLYLAMTKNDSQHYIREERHRRTGLITWIY